jgi:hypothetical protein
VKNNKPWMQVLAYVTNRAIMDRLDAVCGPSGWRNEYREVASGNTKGWLCGISILCPRTTDYSEWITKWDGAEETDIESLKGGLSSSMKRTAVQWGIGRYLYNLEGGFANIHTDRQEGAIWQKGGKTQKGDEYPSFYWTPPTLPAWALPRAKKSDLPQSATPAPAKVDVVSGEIVSKQPKWTDDQKTEIGGIFASLLELSIPDSEIASFRAKFKYTAPSDVIDAAATWLREKRDIADQAKG